MILFDYIVNLSIFSLLVSTPLVIRSFLYRRPLHQLRLWAGLYAGIVSVIVALLSIKQQGYSYDIRYAPVILAFAYLGPAAGIITGCFALLTRLYVSGNWFPAIAGWVFIMVSFSLLQRFMPHYSPLKKCITLFFGYVGLYALTVVTFHILIDKPLFHLEYVVFVMLGVIIGILLIESYESLLRAVTEEKRMKQSLEASESNYRLIAENTSDLIMVMDRTLSIHFFSPSHELVLGYQPSDLKRIELCTLIHPSDAHLFKDTIKRMFEREVPQSIEFRFRHKEGHWIEFESRCMPVKGELHAVDYIVIISRDISERKKAEEILLQSEKLSAVGELAAGVAHEIRNPLTTLKGFIQLYRRDSLIDYNELLLSELDRIEAITNELLSLAKPQAIQLTRADLRELLHNTIELLSPQALMNNIEFHLSCEDRDFFLTCEKNQIKQVFLNILKNAIEAMPEGGNINISLREGMEGECLISVQDQGCGIPEALLPRLGEPFYSLKERGTGLGLMICHKIIKQHNGSIDYVSKVNEGTRIEIRMPMAE